MNYHFSQENGQLEAGNIAILATTESIFIPDGPIEVATLPPLPLAQIGPIAPVGAGGNRSIPGIKALFHIPTKSVIK